MLTRFLPPAAAVRPCAAAFGWPVSAGPAGSRIIGGGPLGQDQPHGEGRRGGGSARPAPRHAAGCIVPAGATAGDQGV